MKLLTCAHCGETRRVPNHYQDCCSRRCAHAYMQQRDPDGYVAQRMEAGARAGERSSDRAAEYWAKKYPGVPMDLVRAIRMSGYHAGYVRGQRKGFEQGKAAAEAQMRIAGVRTVVLREIPA